MAVQSGTPSVPTNQQVNSSALPIVVKTPPPEGTLGAQLTYTLSPLVPEPVVTEAGNGDNGGAGAVTVFYTEDIPSGATIHLNLYIDVIGFNPASLTMADTKGNVFAYEGSVSDVGGDNYVIMSCLDCIAVTTADSITGNYPVNFFFFLEVLAITNVASIDPNVTAGSNTTGYTTGTPVQAGELFVGIFNANPSGWTLVGTSAGFLINPAANAVAVSGAGFNVGYIPGASSGAGPTQSQVIALKGQGGSGFPMSQICSLQIDNTQNDADLLVVHGAFSNSVNVIANSMAIIPTFSTAFSYSIKLTASGDDFTQPITVPVTFLNYPTNYGVYVEPPPSPGTVIPNPMPPTPTTQFSSAVGSSVVNEGLIPQADKDWSGGITLSGVGLSIGAHTFNFTLLPALTDQGYTFTSYQIALQAALLAGGTGTLTVSLGYSIGGTDIGSFPVGSIASAVSGSLANVTNYFVIVPDGKAVILTAVINVTSTGTASGTVSVAAQGIIRPMD